MKHGVDHDLAHDRAREVAKKALQSYAERYQKYQATVSWLNDDKAKIAFSVKGMSLTGELELEPGRIGMELKVPFVLRVFKKQALEVIEREIRIWIEKEKNGEI